MDGLWEVSGLRASLIYSLSTDETVTAVNHNCHLSYQSVWLCALVSCVVQKNLKTLETLPLMTDGIIGLGNCNGTLVEQLWTIKAISQNVLGVCLAKGIHWSMLGATGSPAAPVGFISLGMGFEENFDQRKSVWVKLTDPGLKCGFQRHIYSIWFSSSCWTAFRSTSAVIVINELKRSEMYVFWRVRFFGMCSVLCAYAAKLLSISLFGRRIPVKTIFLGHETVGRPMVLDTGSDMTYLHKDLYDEVLWAVSSSNILNHLPLICHWLELIYSSVICMLWEWISMLDARLMQGPLLSVSPVSVVLVNYMRFKSNFYCMEHSMLKFMSNT